MSQTCTGKWSAQALMTKKKKNDVAMTFSMQTEMTAIRAVLNCSLCLPLCHLKWQPYRLWPVLTQCASVLQYLLITLFVWNP